MAQSFEVLEYLIPNGGYVQYGDKFEDIQFLECEPISKKEYEAGFIAYDAWKEQQDQAKASTKAALLDRLGITEEEAKLLLA